MIRDIDFQSEELNQDYWFFVEALRGRVTDFFVNQDFTAVSNRYRLESRVQAMTESIAKRINERVEYGSRLIAQRASESAVVRLAAAGQRGISKDATERAQRVLEVVTQDVSKTLQEQAARDMRAALKFVMNGSIDRNFVFRGSSPEFSAIDRMSRTWNSAKMVRTAFRHHLVMLYNDIYVDALAESGIDSFELHGVDQSPVPFKLADYESIRSERLHPNTRSWVQ